MLIHQKPFYNTENVLRCQINLKAENDMKNDINTDVIIIKKKALGMTSKQLSELSKVPIGTINKILRGETKSPQINTLSALCKVLGCDINDVLTDDGGHTDVPESVEMLRDNLSVGYLPSDNGSSKHSRRMLTLFYANPYSGAIQKSDMLAHNAPTNCDFAVQMCDSSMEPLIRNGSICYIKKTKNIIVGNIGVFKIDGKLYVRKVEKDCISALNKNYPSFLITEYEKFEGLVVDFVEC